MRDRIRQRPLYWVFAYYATGFGLISLVVDTLVGVWGGPVWAVLAGFLFATIMTPLTWWERKRNRGIRR